MIFQDVVNGRALALKASSISDISGLRVSPLGAVEARKLRVIYVLTFAGDGYGSRVNNDTDFPPPHRVSFVPSLAKFVDRSCTSRITMTRSLASSHVTSCRYQSKRRIPPDSRRAPACC